MNSKSNGLKDKLGKIHSFIHKFGKYFIIACLILFCVLCIKNKDQFAERVAKGVTGKRHGEDRDCRRGYD